MGRRSSRRLKLREQAEVEEILGDVEAGAALTGTAGKATEKVVNATRAALGRESQWSMPASVNAAAGTVKQMVGTALEWPVTSTAAVVVGYELLTGLTGQGGIRREVETQEAKQANAEAGVVALKKTLPELADEDARLRAIVNFLTFVNADPLDVIAFTKHSVVMLNEVFTDGTLTSDTSDFQVCTEEDTKSLLSGYRQATTQFYNSVMPSIFRGLRRVKDYLPRPQLSSRWWSGGTAAAAAPTSAAAGGVLASEKKIRAQVERLCNIFKQTYPFEGLP